MEIVFHYCTTPHCHKINLFKRPFWGNRFERLDDAFVLLISEIECLLNDNHQKGKIMIMIMKTFGSQVDSPVAEGKRKEGGGRKIRDLHKDT